MDIKIKKLNVNKKNMKKLAIALGIAGTLAFSSIEGMMQFSNGGNDLDYTNITYIEEQNNKFVDNFNNIYNNSEELQEEWGEIYPELINFIQEYGAFFDQNKVIHKLKNVEFVHNPRNDSNLLAETDNDHNKIIYNEKLFYKKQAEIKEVKLHEAFHYLFQDCFFKSNFNIFHIGLSLDEGNANLLTEESGVNVKTTLYEKYSTYVKVLCEIVGPEKYLDAAGSHDLFKLLDCLDDYCSRREAINLIKNIDKASNYYDSIGTDYDMKAWETLEKMYEKKHGVTIDNSNDIVMKAYHNKYSGDYYQIPEAQGPTHIRVNKKYFLNKDEPTTINFVRNGKKYGYAVLNDNNEIVSGQVLENAYYDEYDNIVDKDGNYVEDNIINLVDNQSNKKI